MGHSLAGFDFDVQECFYAPMRLSLSLFIFCLFSIPAMAGVEVDLSVLDGASQQPAPRYYSRPAAPKPVIQHAQQAKPAKTLPKAVPQPAAGSPTPDAPEGGLWGAKWSGNANLGLTIKSGNTDSEAFDTDAKVKADWDKHRAELLADYAREKENDIKTVDEKSLEALYDYFFAEKWFADFNAKFETDDISALDLRTTLGVGLGHQLYDRDNLSLKFVLGPSYLKEEYASGSNDSSMAYHWKLDYEQKFWDDLIRLFHNHDLLVPSDTTDEYIFKTETGIRVPLKKSLIASLQIDHDIDKGAPIGTSQNDTKYALKLGYEW